MADRKPLIHAGNRVQIAILVISALLVVLNVLRILHVPLTFDECAPYAEITRPYWNILCFDAVSANNHILNTLCRKFFVEAFADTPFWLRFDSLLAQLMFLWYSYRLSSRLFTDRTWQIPVFILLNLHPFMFEFWGLSRGYGLSIAFMTGSVYWLVRYVQDKRMLFLNAGLYFAILAAYSNFTLMDYYCGIICFLVLRSVLPAAEKRNYRVMLSELLSIVIASAVLYVAVAGPIRRLIEDNQLYYGGNNGFVADTLVSVIKENMFLGGPSVAPLLNILATTTVVITIATGMCWGIKLIKKRPGTGEMTGILLWVLVAAPGIGFVAQHLLLGTLYPINRSGLFFIPLFMLSLIYWLSDITRTKRLIGNIIIYLLTAAILYNFVSNMNISSTRMWWFGCNDLVVLNRIAQESKDNPRKSKVCAFWIFIPSFNYYIETASYGRYIETALEFKDGKPKNDSSFDYYYIPAEVRSLIPQCYVVDTGFYGNSFLLLRRVGR